MNCQELSRLRTLLLSNSLSSSCSTKSGELRRADDGPRPRPGRRKESLGFMATLPPKQDVREEREHWLHGDTSTQSRCGLVPMRFRRHKPTNQDGNPTTLPTSKLYTG